ncbi:MAG: SufD family Fe-S cluster assembly protein [Candidatus Daviesbacteria bacterium]|nr:SufD family Fe-S cluster assembly protein [Candidatus Daviesbacteria bacterium]
MLIDLFSGDKKKMRSVGMNFNSSKISGSLFIQNKDPIYHLMSDPGVEVLDMKMALNKYHSLKKYYWKLIDPKQDEYTGQVFNDFHQGYFIRSKPGQKVELPVQACLFIAREKFSQNIHNIIIAEEGSELNIVTGCLTADYIKEALHIGITEMYVKKGAKLTFTMVHNWGEKIKVRPRTATQVEKNGIFLSNYICIKPVADLQMSPTCYLNGEGSVGRYNSLLYSYPNSSIDVGTKVFLEAEKARAEVVTKAICSGGEIVIRGYIKGSASKIKSHLDCKGLITGRGGRMRAIPELEANMPDLDMTHEAAIGKISAEQLEYLEARGISEKESLSLITKGFLDITSMNLPSGLDHQLIDYLETL